MSEEATVAVIMGEVKIDKGQPLGIVPNRLEKAKGIFGQNANEISPSTSSSKHRHSGASRNPEKRCEAFTSSTYRLK